MERQGNPVDGEAVVRLLRDMVILMRDDDGVDGAQALEKKGKALRRPAEAGAGVNVEDFQSAVVQGIFWAGR